GAGGQPAAVRAPAEAGDFPPVFLEGVQLFPALGVPEDDGPVAGAGGDPGRVGTPADAHHLIDVPLEGPHATAGPDVPDRSRGLIEVGIAGGNPAPLRAPARVVDPGAFDSHRLLHSARLRVPDFQGGVPATRQYPAAVGAPLREVGQRAFQSAELFSLR